VMECSSVCYQTHTSDVYARVLFYFPRLCLHHGFILFAIVLNVVRPHVSYDDVYEFWCHPNHVAVPSYQLGRFVSSLPMTVGVIAYDSNVMSHAEAFVVGSIVVSTRFHYRHSPGIQSVATCKTLSVANAFLFEQHTIELHVGRLLVDRQQVGHIPLRQEATDCYHQIAGKGVNARPWNWKTASFGGTSPSNCLIACVACTVTIHCRRPCSLPLLFVMGAIIFTLANYDSSPPFWVP